MRDGILAQVVLGETADVARHDSKAPILAVGDKSGWLVTHGKLNEVPPIQYTDIENVIHALISGPTPALVVSPVLCTAFDCIDLSHMLSEHGYSGPYRAVGADLPRPQMIEAEIRGLCPRLDFAIIDTI